MRLSNFYSIGIIIGIFSILFSSCSSVKEGSYAYMDDIYVNQYPDEVIVLSDEVIDDENGEPPSNVPGAAYVYQPIPEPKLTNSTPYTYSPYTSVYDDEEYYNDEYYNPNGIAYSPFSSNFPIGVTFDLFFNVFNSYYSPFPGSANNGTYSGACVASNSNSGSSSSFITKRFSWSDSANEIIQYLSSQSNISGSANSTTNKSSSSSRKPRFTNSNSSSDSKAGDGFIKFLSTAIENSGNTRSSDGNTRSSGSSKSSSGSSGTTRSSGSSKSSGGTYSGKRIR